MRSEWQALYLSEEGGIEQESAEQGRPTNANLSAKRLRGSSV